MRRFALLGLILLAACQSAPEQTVLPPIEFTNRAPIQLAVASIEVVDAYKSPFAKPNVEHEFITTPTAMVHRWANGRLKAAGGMGKMEIVVEDASVKQVDLPVKEGMRGFFSNEQSARYDARVKVTMRLFDGINTMSRAEADIEVSRSQTISEKATVAEREKLWHDMTRELGAAFDKEAQARMQQYFAAYLR